LSLRAWRLTHARHAADALSGEGARLYGGRWNPPGLRVVYASAHVSLAALELLVRLNRWELLEPYVLTELEFPRSLVREVSIRELPADWKALPYSPATQRLGERRLRAGGGAVLRVPSAVIDLEYNYVFNVEHADFRRVSATPPRPFRFDPRLARRGGSAAGTVGA